MFSPNKSISRESAAIKADDYFREQCRRLGRPSPTKDKDLVFCGFIHTGENLCQMSPAADINTLKKTPETAKPRKIRASKTA